MGRMGPVEEDQTCLTFFLELKVEISLLAAPRREEDLWAAFPTTQH